MNELRGHVVGLCESDSGNFVMSKIVQVMPAQSLHFLVVEFGGKMERLASHCRGCRVLMRMLEHFPEELVAPLLDELEPSITKLSYHPYGNLVVQHLLEYSTQRRRMAVIHKVCLDLPVLTQYKSSSYVLQRIVAHGGDEGQRVLVKALLEIQSPSLIDVACTRYGSFCVDCLADLQVGRSEVHEQLAAAMPRLQASKFGVRAIMRFDFTSRGLAPSPVFF